LQSFQIAKTGIKQAKATNLPLQSSSQHPADRFPAGVPFITVVAGVEHGTDVAIEALDDANAGRPWQLRQIRLLTEQPCTAAQFRRQKTSECCSTTIFVSTPEYRSPLRSDDQLEKPVDIGCNRRRQ